MAASKNSDKKRPSRTRIKEMMGIAVSKFIKGLEGGTGISKEQCMLDAGYAPSTANKQNHKIIQHPDYIAWTERKSENDFASKSAIEKNYHKFASSNITDYMDENGTFSLKHIKSLPRHLTDCIESIRVTKLGVEVKLVSKLGAQDSLAKINGLFIAKVEHTGEGGGPIEYFFGSDNLSKEVADKYAKPNNRLKDYASNN